MATDPGTPLSVIADSDPPVPAPQGPAVGVQTAGVQAVDPPSAPAVHVHDGDEGGMHESGYPSQPYPADYFPANPFISGFSLSPHTVHSGPATAAPVAMGDERLLNMLLDEVRQLRGSFDPIISRQERHEERMGRVEELIQKLFSLHSEPSYKPVSTPLEFGGPGPKLEHMLTSSSQSPHRSGIVHSLPTFSAPLSGVDAKAVNESYIKLKHGLIDDTIRTNFLPNILTVGNGPISSPIHNCLLYINWRCNRLISALKAVYLYDPFCAFMAAPECITGDQTDIDALEGQVRSLITRLIKIH